MTTRLSCKDIADEIFLAAVDQTEPMAGTWRHRFGVRDTLQRLIGAPIAHNLVLAKARKLIDKGLLHGCPCGCRGDFHLPPIEHDGPCC